MIEESAILGRLERIEDLLTALVKSNLARVASRELTDPRMRRLYDLTGEVTSREAAKRIGSSMRTVTEAWQRWERLGLLLRYGKRYKKVI